jgi:hypothetical protein
MPVRADSVPAGEEVSMAISPRMLAFIQKTEAADAAHFARLRKGAEQDAE